MLRSTIPFLNLAHLGATNAVFSGDVLSQHCAAQRPNFLSLGIGNLACSIGFAKVPGTETKSNRMTRVLFGSGPLKVRDVIIRFISIEMIHLIAKWIGVWYEGESNEPMNPDAILYTIAGDPLNGISVASAKRRIKDFPRVSMPTFSDTHHPSVIADGIERLKTRGRFPLFTHARQCKSFRSMEAS